MSSSFDRNAEKQLVKARVRLDELARELAGCEFEPRGPDDLWACCPFHDEDTPSFHVRPRLGHYKCFGCQASGDAFSFVMEQRGVGFREALEFLADRVGVELGSLTPEERRKHTEQQRARKVLEVAASAFGHSFAAAGNPARAYMHDRGFADETLERFDVGYVSADFASALRQSGLGQRDVDGAGFTRAFAERISFGIRDDRGGLVGFGARTLIPEHKPKYVNTRETPAFNKRSLLYGLDKAMRTIARSGRVLVMEGYTDVMMAHQRGLTESVAAMGTSLTEQHVGQLKRRARNLVFVFDGDDAGRSAAERAVRLVLSEGLECRVLVLPDGADPGDWLKVHDADAFEALLESEGEGTVPFLCRRGLEAIDRGQPGAREQVARDVLDATRVLVDPLRRDSIAAEIARACAVDRNLMAKAAGIGFSPSGSSMPQSSTSQRPVSASVRCQFAALAGLALDGLAKEELVELRDDGLLSHPTAVRLLEIGLALETEPVDAQEWLLAAAEIEPALRTALERSLFPPPEVFLPPWDEAIDHLRGQQVKDREAQARRAALSHSDIADDEAALRAIADSLAAKGAAPATLSAPSTLDTVMEPGSPDPASESEPDLHQPTSPSEDDSW